MGVRSPDNIETQKEAPGQHHCHPRVPMWEEEEFTEETEEQASQTG